MTLLPAESRISKYNEFIVSAQNRWSNISPIYNHPLSQWSVWCCRIAMHYYRVRSRVTHTELTRRSTQSSRLQWLERASSRPFGSTFRRGWAQRDALLALLLLVELFLTLCDLRADNETRDAVKAQKADRKVRELTQASSTSLTEALKAPFSSVPSERALNAAQQQNTTPPSALTCCTAARRSRRHSASESWPGRRVGCDLLHAKEARIRTRSQKQREILATHRLESGGGQHHDDQ